MTTTTNPAVAANVASAASIPQTTAFAQYDAEKQMSFVTRHDVKTVVNTGFRICTIRYRDTTKGVAVKQAQQAVIPQVVLTPEVLAVLPQKYAEVLVSVLEDAQDDMVRVFIDNSITTISWEDVSADRVIEFLTAARVSERLTKERIEAWVPVALGEILKQRALEVCEQKKVADKPEEVAKQIAGTTNAYVSAFAKLAAAVPNVKQNEAQALEIMINRELVSEELDSDGNVIEVRSTVQDDISKALRKKLEAILRPVILENVDL